MRGCKVSYVFYIDFSIANSNQLMSMVQFFAISFFQDIKIKLNGELLVYCKLVAQLEEKIKNLMCSKKDCTERKAQYKRVVHYHKAECQNSSSSSSSRNSLASRLGFK